MQSFVETARRRSTVDATRKRWGSGGPLDLVRTDKEVGGNFPRLADLVDHLDRKRAPAGQNFRGTRARSEEFRQLSLSVTEFVDGVAEHVDRVEIPVDVDRPSLRLIDVDQREQHIELVALLSALRRAPTGFDLRERRAMVL